MLATAPADSDETFTVAQRTVCAVAATVKVAGGAPSVQACAVFLRAESNRRMGINTK